MAKRAGWLAFLAWAGVAISAGAAAAGPVVSVGARTTLELEPVRRLPPDGIQIHGKLLDRYSRAPIEWQTLQIQVDNEYRVATTNSEGHFEANFFGITGSNHALIVTYDGKPDEFSSATLEITNFDIAKRPLSLTLTLDREVVAYADARLQVTVLGRSEEHPPAGLGPIDLRIGDDDSDQLDRVASLRTGADGKASIALKGAQLGKPGRKRVEVRFAGDGEWDSARADLGFLLRTDTSLAFALDDGDVAHEDTIRGSGKLLDDAGGGVAGATIELATVEAPPGSPQPGQTTTLAKATTDDDGSFSLSVKASELGPGRFNLQAVFDSSVDYQRDSRAVVKVDIAQPRPAPVSYTLLVFGATVLAVLAFIALRTRPWEKIKWRRRTNPAATAEEERPAGAEAPRAGLQLARPSVMSTLRRVRDTGFVGAVTNAVNGRPVGGATLSLASAAHAAQEVDSDGAGRFEIEGLAGGSWQVTVSAYGYCTERFTITVPHRGELRGARIDLLPVRERIFALYGECARPLLPETGLWGIWTPRQIFSHVRTHRPAPALSELTDFVEEAYFSQRTPDETAVDVTRDRIARVRAEASPPQSPPA